LWFFLPAARDFFIGALLLHHACIFVCNTLFAGVGHKIRECFAWLGTTKVGSVYRRLEMRMEVLADRSSLIRKIRACCCCKKKSTVAPEPITEANVEAGEEGRAVDEPAVEEAREALPVAVAVPAPVES
jgi:hypothetical protein